MKLSDLLARLTQELRDRGDVEVFVEYWAEDAYAWQNDDFVVEFDRDALLLTTR